MTNPMIQSFGAPGIIGAAGGMGGINGAFGPGTANGATGSFLSALLAQHAAQLGGAVPTMPQLTQGQSAPGTPMTQSQMLGQALANYVPQNQGGM